MNVCVPCFVNSFQDSPKPIWIFKGTRYLDRAIWAKQKRLLYELKWNEYGWKDVLKVEYNDPHKYASKLCGFPFSLWTIILPAIFIFILFYFLFFFFGGGPKFDRRSLVKILLESICLCSIQKRIQCLAKPISNPLLLQVERIFVYCLYEINSARIARLWSLVHGLFPSHVYSNLVIQKLYMFNEKFHHTETLKWGEQKERIELKHNFEVEAQKINNNK